VYGKGMDRNAFFCLAHHITDVANDLYVTTQDYVRCGTASVTSSDILVTGEFCIF